MTLEQVRNGLQKLFNAGPGVACSAFPLAHWINAIEEHIQGDEARDTAITDAFDEAHPIYTHPPAQAAQVPDLVRYAIERCLAAQANFATGIDEANPDDKYASLMVNEDIDTIRQWLEQAPAQPTKLEDAVREVVANMQLKLERDRFAGKASITEWSYKLTAALQENAK